MDMEKLIFVDYNDRVKVDMDTLIVAMWDRYLEYEGKEENKIFLNNKEFFENSFDNSYDAAWAVSTGDWRWADKFVCFDSDGHLSSFSHWDDDESPIDPDKIDLDSLIHGLERWKNAKRYVNNIPKAIHDALQHDALQEV